MPKSMEHTEEVAGILSLQLYDLRSCGSILKAIRELNDWSEARVSARQQDGSFSSAFNPQTRSASAFTPPYESPLRHEFDEKINRLVKPLVTQIWGVDLTEHSGTHIVRYIPGNYYAAHTDTGVTLNNRHFTILCYLNEDFKGGQTSFPRLGYSVAPRSGKAVIFPATYFHRAETVVDGEKYIYVSWLMGPEPIDWP